MVIDFQLTMTQARAMRGFSQKHAAEMLDVHRQTLGKWEKNAADMPMGKAKEFAKLVGMEMSDIKFEV